MASMAGVGSDASVIMAGSPEELAGPAPLHSLAPVTRAERISSMHAPRIPDLERRHPVLLRLGRVTVSISLSQCSGQAIAVSGGHSSAG